METFCINAADGCDVPIYWAMPTQQPRVTLLLLPALGIQARLYRQLASALTAQGCATAIMEQRGHGLSKLKPGYGVRFGVDAFLHQDIPAVMAAFDGPVLSVSFERDDFSIHAAVARALSPFSAAKVMRLELGEREQGTFLGHTDWAKQPDDAAAAIGAWLDRHFPCG